MLQLTKQDRVDIDLQGPSGNVFVLIKTGMDLGFRLGMVRESVEALLKGENSQLQWSYEHTVAMFEHLFGDYFNIHGDPELIDSIGQCADHIRLEELRLSRFKEAISIVL
ncbi:hypothetical protein ACPV5U_24460 [Vibrio mediterranei]